MKPSQISYLWKNPGAARDFSTGVSLHSHTNRSKETLDFVVKFIASDGFWGRLYRRLEPMHAKHAILKPDYARGYWTPPLTPRLAFDLERRQIESKLQRSALVSITDHDNIEAPQLLRTVASARHIPVSVEWTVPFAGDQSFHLGIHNLPSAYGAEWMRIFEEFTANPSDARLTELLSALHALPNVLIVFNHPMWDLYEIGGARHALRLEEFLEQNGEFIHALELNGLRGWNENRVVRSLAERWNKLLISGGDRHGLEPNGNVNLTNATSFNEFVHEIRNEVRSHVLFMPQYAEPWKHRIMQSTLDAVRNYPDFPVGSRRWDERVYHPDATGIPRPVSALWPAGHAPLALRLSIQAVRLMGCAPFSGSLRLAWNESRQLQFALGEGEPV
ncbi:MAG TPA: hypothetical protein VGM11_02105 [Acidobacteriaceae bacterium]